MFDHVKFGVSEMTRATRMSMLRRITCGMIGVTILGFALVVGMHLPEPGTILDRLSPQRIEAILIAVVVLVAFPPVFLYAAIFGRFPEIGKRTTIGREDDRKLE